MNYIIILGNPVDGLAFYGPFSEFDEAETWANQNMDDSTWWVGVLDPPAV